MLAEVLKDPLLGALLRYWLEKRGDREVPRRQDIDPVEMGPRLLPHLMLCDLLEDGSRVRFRLVGTTIVKRFGTDPTGQYIGDRLSSGYPELLAGLHHLVYARRAPVYSVSGFRGADASTLQARHLLLPLTRDGADPAIVLACVVFSPDEAGITWPRLLDHQAAYRELRRSVLEVPAPGRPA